MMRSQASTEPLIFCIAVSILLTGCRPSERPSGLVSRDTVAGVEVVHNPGSPLGRMSSAYRALWSAPTADDASQFGDWDSASSLVLDGERIYVLDEMASRVYVVRATEGGVEGTIGRPGSGPGEFERPFGLAFLRGEVIVGNGAAARLERFRPDGSYLGAIPIGRLGFGLLSLPSGELYLNALLGSEGGWSRVRDDGAVAEVEWPPPVEVDIGECTRFGGGAGLLVRVSCTQPVLQIVSSDGHAVREIALDIPPRRPDPAKLQDHLSNVRRVMTQSEMNAGLIETQLRRERERLALLPIIRAVGVDAVGGLITLWEQVPEELGGGTATLHILAPAGEYLAALEFTDAWVDYAVHDSRVYALVREPNTGLIRLAAYAIGH